MQTAPRQKLLIIDDDVEIADMLKDYFVKHGFVVITALNGLELTRLLKVHSFDLVVLDVMLPGIDGLSLCQKLRQHHDMPILMLSAAASEADRVAGLELGADDYLTKPFSTRELLARVKALLRRAGGELTVQADRPAPITFGHWLLDRQQQCLIGQNKVVVTLSQREYTLLMLLLRHPKRILSRAQLVEWLYDKTMDPLDRTIDVLIGRLRKKIELDAKHPKILKTIRGGGYQLTVNVTRGKLRC